MIKWKYFLNMRSHSIKYWSNLNAKKKKRKKWKLEQFYGYLEVSTSDLLRYFSSILFHLPPAASSIIWRSSQENESISEFKRTLLEYNLRSSMDEKKKKEERNRAAKATTQRVVQPRKCGEKIAERRRNWIIESIASTEWLGTPARCIHVCGARKAFLIDGDDRPLPRSTWSFNSHQLDCAIVNTAFSDRFYIIARRESSWRCRKMHVHQKQIELNSKTISIPFIKRGRADQLMPSEFSTNHRAWVNKEEKKVYFWFVGRSIALMNAGFAVE